MPKSIICKQCGEIRSHCAKGLCVDCYHCQYRKSHKDERREYSHQYYITHKEQYSEYNRRWRETHVEERREYHDQWRKSHPDNHSQWCRTNKERRREQARANDHRRRARQRDATIEAVNEATIYARDMHMCVYCGATNNLTLDHIVPLASGGTHCEDNLVVACLSCNCSKQDKPLEEWLQIRPAALVWVL